MKFAADALVVLAMVWIGLVILAAVFQRRMIYFPLGEVPPPSAAGLDAAEEVAFLAADRVRLHGWFVRPRGTPSAFTIVVFNGNAGNRAYRAPLAHAFRERGLGVLLFDYRGFGGNEGRPTEEGLALDAAAARAYLRSRGDVDQSRVAYFGESLGGAVAIRLAQEDPPAVLVLRSPFASLAAVARAHYPFLPVGLLLRDRYDSLERIPGLSCPLLVIAGGRDGIVPAAQSRALFDAARGPKRLVIVEGADHNDAELVLGPAVVEATVRALDEWGNERPAAR